MFGVGFFFWNINRLYSLLFSGLKWFCTARTSLSKCVFVLFFSGMVCSDGSSSIRSFTSSPTKVKSIAFFPFIVFYFVSSEIISQSVDIFCPFWRFVLWFVVKFWVMWEGSHVVCFFFWFFLHVGRFVLFFFFMFLVSKRLFLRRQCKVFISEVMNTCLVIDYYQDESIRWMMIKDRWENEYLLLSWHIPLLTKSPGCSRGRNPGGIRGYFPFVSLGYNKYHIL